MDTLRSDISSICYALVLRSLWAKEKRSQLLWLLPHQGTETVSSPLKSGQAWDSFGQAVWWKGPCVFWNKVLKVILPLCGPLKPVPCSEKPKQGGSHMWTHRSTVPGSPCFKPSSPGNTCLGEEATRWFQPPASGQPSHSNLSKWDPRSPFCVPYCFLTHSICEHNNMIAILPPQSLGSFVTQHSTRTPTITSAHVAQTCPEFTSQSTSILTTGFPSGSVVKNPPASAGDTEDVGSIPRSGRFPWRRKWQPTPVFLSGESHGAWQGTVCRVAKSQTWLSTHAYIHTYTQPNYEFSASPNTNFPS